MRDGEYTIIGSNGHEFESSIKVADAATREILVLAISNPGWAFDPSSQSSTAEGTDIIARRNRAIELRDTLNYALGQAASGAHPGFTKSKHNQVAYLPPKKHFMLAAREDLTHDGANWLSRRFDVDSLFELGLAANVNLFDASPAQLVSLMVLKEFPGQFSTLKYIVQQTKSSVILHHLRNIA